MVAIQHLEKWSLHERVCNQQAILQNTAGTLWDIGDGIACLEFTTECNLLRPESFHLLDEVITKVGRDFDGLVIGDDNPDFSYGLDMQPILDACVAKDWDKVYAFVQRGQLVMMALKQAPFPVVAAVSGVAMGSACELMLHCDTVQLYEPCSIGIDSLRYGLTPCFGGCAEMLVRHMKHMVSAGSSLQACESVFRLLSNRAVAHSWQEAVDMQLLSYDSGISRHRKQLLPDAKSKCLSMTSHYNPPALGSVSVAREAVREVLAISIANRFDSGKIDAYERRALQWLAFIISAGTTNFDITGDLELAAIIDIRDATDVPDEVSVLEILDYESRAFMSLVKQAYTHEKISLAYMKEDCMDGV